MNLQEIDFPSPFTILILQKTKGMTGQKKSYGVLPVSDQLNTAYQTAVSNAGKQVTDEHKANFKGRHFC